MKPDGVVSEILEIRENKMEYILGIDIGTSSCKAAVFDLSGNVIDARTKEYPVYYPQPGWVEQNPEEWWTQVCAAVKGLLDGGNIKPSDIKAVGVDGQSWSAILADKNGEILLPSPIWMDTRAESICERVRKDIGEDAIFELCGNPFAPTYTTPKLIWFKENHPGAFKRTYKVLQSNSYIVYKLTGKFTQDESQAYGLHFYDMRRGHFNKEMASEMGLDADMIPDISECHKIVGAVSAEASALTGLLHGTPVVAGGLDAACGTLGAGVIHDGQTQEQGGQAGGMSICIEQYKAHPKLIMSNHVVPGRWLLQGGTVSGGGALKWLREKQFPDLSFAEMDKIAEVVPPGAEGLVFLPYMAGERSPIWDKHAKGVYFGLDYTKWRGHIVRATMEGAAFALLHNIKTAEEAGVMVSAMTAMGGAANSGVWTQMKSDMTGKPISVSSSDTATTLGAAILAGVGTGMYGSFDEAVKKTVTVRISHSPDMKNHEIYSRTFKIYLELYEKLKDTMRGGLI